MEPIRPQDAYPRVGRLTGTVRSLADELAVLRVACETWDGDALRVDAGSPWSVSESLAATVGDLEAAEDALRTAVGRLEAA
ncbi:MAG TPA: hypothetical protein PKC36_07000, partial [Dietzia sp.]|nr:hypothetical protein [Dietzia sp.]